jgi:hypothetical protein
MLVLVLNLKHKIFQQQNYNSLHKINLILVFVCYVSNSTFSLQTREGKKGFLKLTWKKYVRIQEQ